MIINKTFLQKRIARIFFVSYNIFYKPVSKGGWNAVKNSMAQAEAKGEEAMKAMENTK